MKKNLQTALFAWSLALFGGDVVMWSKDKETISVSVPSTESTTTTIQDRIHIIISTNLWADTPKEEQQKIKDVFLREIGRDLNEQDVEKLTMLLQKKEVQDGLYSIIKEDKKWAIGRLILALLLGIGYGYAYLAQITGQIKEGKAVNAKSFLTFWSISGAMMILNGLDPGSLVYFESFVLAFVSVAIDKYNTKYGRHNKNNLLKEFIRNAPFPMSQYNKDGLAIEWNPKMEEATGYSHEEILAHYNKEKAHLPPEEHPYIIMRFLYRQEKNFEKVKKYLEMKEKTQKEYIDVSFTMDTKFGERTFHWSAFPDKVNGGDLRIAKHLTDTKDIGRELAKTDELIAELTKTRQELSKEEKLRREIEENSKRDELTGVYNTKAFNEDMKSLTREYREKNMVMIIIDIDDFKIFNDKYGHATGDAVLKRFSQFVQVNLHRKDDKIYRVGGDEFIILLESDDLEGVTKKFNRIRHDLSHEFLEIWGRKIPNGIKSSWGITQFTSRFCLEDEQIPTAVESLKSQADSYMYAVKFYKKYFADELLLQGKIRESDVEKNGVAKAIYSPEWEIIGVEVFNEYGNFTITLDELKTIQERKLTDDALSRQR